MHRRPLLERLWVQASLIFGLATLIGLFQASQWYFYLTLEGKEVPWWSAFTRGVSDWYVWALWTPLVFYLARTDPLVGRHWKRSLLLHGAVSILLSTVTLGLMIPVLIATRPPSFRPRSVDDVASVLFTGHFLFYLWIYWSIVGVQHAFDYYRKYQERVLRASQLEARLAQARLQVLKMQLHPHFLFNTLNAISSLMHQDLELADRMIARLGTLLRLSLENEGAQEVPLSQELDFVQAYLEIEQARLGERLVVHLDVAPETLDAYVPNLVLQPLVENAIRHAIALSAEGGCLTICTRRSDHQLYLSIQDDGPGLPEGARKEGIGLANTRKRLKQLYGEQHRFELQNVTPHGLCVTIVLPFHVQSGSKVEVNLFESQVTDGSILEQALQAAK